MGEQKIFSDRLMTILRDVDSKYDWHHNCRLCEVIDLLEGDDYLT